MAAITVRNLKITGDEDMGEDEIYLKVIATSMGAPGGDEYTSEGSSNSISPGF